MAPKISYFEIEDLIVKVQEQPALYDKGHDDYKRTNLKNKIWRSITMELFVEDWPLWSENLKEKKVQQMKAKWKHVRDNFKKEMRLELAEQRSGSGRSKRQPYKHTGMLAFLRPCLEMRNTEDNIPCSTDEESNQSMDTSELEMNSEDRNSEIDLTQDISEGTFSEGTPECSVGKPSAKKLATTDVRVKKNSKKNKEEDLMSSLKTCMTVIKEKGQPLSEAQSLAQSLIPLIERVPQENMFALRHALLDAIYAQIPTTTGKHVVAVQSPAQGQYSPPNYRQHTVYPSVKPMESGMPPSSNLRSSMHDEYLRKYSLKPAQYNVPPHAEVQRTYQQHHLQSFEHLQQTNVRNPQIGTSRPFTYFTQRDDNKGDDCNVPYMSSSYGIPANPETTQTFNDTALPTSFINELRSGSPHPRNCPDRIGDRNREAHIKYTQSQQSFPSVETSNTAGTSSTERELYADL